MRKIGKRWVVVSAVLLGLLGGTCAVKVNADSTAQNNNVTQVTSAASNNPQSSSDDVMVFGTSSSASSASSSSSVSSASNSNAMTLQDMSKNLNSLDTNLTDYNSSYISSELGIDANAAASLADSISPQSSASVTSSSASSATSTSVSNGSMPSSSISSSTGSSANSGASTSTSNGNYITPVSSSSAKAKKATPSNATQPSVVKVAHKLLLHDNKHFTAGNSVYAVYPGMTFQVINVVKDHRATRYVVNYEGHDYFITASPRYVNKVNNQTSHNHAYLYKSDFKKGHKMTVKTRTNICEYKRLTFNKRTLVKRIKAHKKLSVKKVVSMNNGKMTRLELTNHRYITANVKCVSVVN